MTCDLCNRDPRVPGSLLCATCGESVSRLMVLDAWERNRQDDIRRNQEQTAVLKSFYRQQHRKEFCAECGRFKVVNAAGVCAGCEN